MLGVKEDKVKIVYPTLPKAFIDKTISTKKYPIKSPLNIPSNYCVYIGDVTWNKNIVSIARAIKIAAIPCVFIGKSFTRSATSHPWDKAFEQFQFIAQDDPRF